MPIRAGSGGLKYPLTNQAQIQAQRSAASASAGGSASASAYATNQRRASDNKQLRYNMLQAEMQRGFQAEQAFFDREHQMGGQLNAQAFRGYLQQEGQRFEGEQAQLNRDFRGEQSQFERDFRFDEGQRDRDFTKQRDQRRFEQDQVEFERRVDSQIEMGIRSGQLELDPASQAKLNKLESGKPDLSKLTPDQQAEWQRKYEAEKRNILRTAKKAIGPSAAAQFKKRIAYVDEQGGIHDQPGQGRTAVDTETGKPVDTGQAKQQAEEKKQQQAYENAVTKQFQQNMKDKDPITGEPRYKDENEAAEAAIRQVEALQKRLPGQQGAAPPGAQGGASAVPVGPPVSGLNGPVANNVVPPPPGAETAATRTIPVSPSGTPLPAGLPPNSQWVGDQMIQLPDGRVLQKKAEPDPPRRQRPKPMTPAQLGY